MRKSDYIDIAKGLAKFAHENKTYSSGALNSIFESLHPSAEAQSQNYPRLLEMDDAYRAELDRLAEAEKSPLTVAYERHEAEALKRTEGEV